jgi:hypothetical protein
MDKDWVLIEEIKRLLKNPDFKQAIYHKVQEWNHLTGVGQTKVDHIKREIEYLATSTPPDDFLELDFQLTKTDDSWCLSGKGDQPDLPKALIEKIIMLSNEHPLVLYRAVQIPGLKPVFVSFTKEEDTITGTIKEKREEKGQRPHSPFSEQDVKNIRIMIDYMAENKDFRDHIFDELYQKWIPLIDRGLIAK